MSTGYIPVDGIGTIMTQWTNLKDFNGEIGKLFKEKLKKDKNATWYILNFSLFALNNQSDMEVIMDAASSEDRNINIEWNFQTPEFVLNNYYSKLILYYLLPDII